MPTAKKQDVRNPSIKDFFKPFTIPKNRIPANDIIEEEIIVSSQPRSSSPVRLERKLALSPRKRQNGRKSPASSQGSSAISSLSSSPTKRSTPRTTPKLLETVVESEHRESAPQPQIHVSSSGSQRRVMSAVEIPSPQLTEQKEEVATAGLLNTSFSTITSFSSIPASTASSSRRVTTKSGIQAITNSDSGSAESSSEDELADMSTFIPRKRVKLTPPDDTDEGRSIETPSTVKPATRRTARVSKSNEQLKFASTPTAVPVYKYSLAALVKQQQKDSDIEKRMKDLEDASSERQRQRDKKKQVVRSAVSGLQVAVTEDSDEGERVMLAMQRTGALEDDEKFYYFDGHEDQLHNDGFPAAVEGESPWIRKLRGERWRTQACLSGFAAELARKDRLPTAIQIWLARQLIHEKRADLCEAYIGVLEAHESFLDEKLLLALLKNSVLTASSEPKSRQPDKLAYVLRLMQHLTSDKWYAQHVIRLSHLIFTNIDANVEQHAPSRFAIEDCIESILNRVPADLLKDFYRQLETLIIAAKYSTHVKCKAVAAMPARSEASYTCRRLLATRLVIDGLDLVPVRHNPTCWAFAELPMHSECAETILDRLKTAPELAISEATDYGLLNPLIQILDIAIGNGFDLPESDRSSKEFTKQFNAQVDAFIDQLSITESRIRDAGTTHLRRTQAKSAIERLAKKLEYGVRTKPRPRKGVFSNGHVIDEPQQSFLKGFFKAADARARPLDSADQASMGLGAAVES